MLRESARAEGNGGDIAASKQTAKDRDDLVTLHSEKAFILSCTLKQLIEGEYDC